jgi:hypothetical protein
MQVSRSLVAAAAITILTVAAGHAEQYPGWGDTGWMYGSKRECCNSAVAIAQDYSAQACVNSGGMPRPFSGGGQRGSCTSVWMQDTDGSVLWRCYGEAAIWCR